jgi:hypothetical protein
MKKIVASDAEISKPENGKIVVVCNFGFAALLVLQSDDISQFQQRLKSSCKAAGLTA